MNTYLNKQQINVFGRTRLRKLMFMRFWFRPEMWWGWILERLNEILRILSDESEYEPQYAYGTDIYQDFMFNVGRKIHILKSAIKVLVNSPSFYVNIITCTGLVLSDRLSWLSREQTDGGCSPHQADGVHTELPARPALPQPAGDVQANNVQQDQGSWLGGGLLPRWRLLRKELQLSCFTWTLTWGHFQTFKRFIIL